MDDLADGSATLSPAGLRPSSALLGSILCSHSLPMGILSQLKVPEALRVALAQDLAECSLVGVEGQLREFHADPADASEDSVLNSYRGKNGAGFAMAAVMAARLAGASTRELSLWREFGLGFGALRQLRNDQDDLVSGHDDDLRNAVVTHLFAHLLAGSDKPTRQRLLALHRAAPTSPDARRDLKNQLLDATVIRGYSGVVGTLQAALHRILDELGGGSAFLQALHGLVRESAQLHPTLIGAVRETGDLPSTASRAR
ncbi:MAG: polyprenyl synthetase family protein [Myxococcaceae bacterium]